eukprot:6210663-Pleurochrysis_carterae.AAC.1
MQWLCLSSNPASASDFLIQLCSVLCVTAALSVSEALERLDAVDLRAIIVIPDDVPGLGCVERRLARLRPSDAQPERSNHHPHTAHLKSQRRPWSGRGFGRPRSNFDIEGRETVLQDNEEKQA